MYNAIIVEDEFKVRELIELKVNKLDTEINIVDKVANVQDALKSIEINNPNIVFLDIHLPGESGFDLLDYIEDIKFQVIFVTGFNDYALKALKSNAIDYVLKPIVDDHLFKAIEKAKIKIGENVQLQNFDTLKENMSFQSNVSRISVANNKGYEFVEIDNLVRCEGFQKYTKLMLEDGRTLISSYNLGMYRKKLSETFFMTHKSHLVHKSKIRKFLKEGMVVMNDGSKVPVSKRRKEEFLKLFDLG